MIAVCILFITLFSPSTANTQESRKGDWETNVPWHNNDYFRCSEDPTLKALLANVEHAHLGNGFWNNYKRGNYQWAPDDIKYALRVFPNHPKALLLMGSIAKLTNDFGLPIPWYQKALTLFPQNALTHAQYGGYLADIGEVQEGITRLQKAIKIDPRLAFAYDRLSEAYTKNGNQEMARQSAQKAIELSTQNEK